MMDVFLRQTAEGDIEGGFDHCLTSAGGSVAAEFVLAISAALAHIGEFPGTGSTRYGELLDTPRLRFWLVRNFPYVLFCIERETHLDVIRVLHQKSDIPAQLRSDLPDSAADV